MASFFTSRQRWQTMAVGWLGLAALVVLYLSDMTFPGRISPAEATKAMQHNSLNGVLHDSAYWPYGIVQTGLFHVLGQHSLIALRLPAVLTALVACLLFYWLIRRWHGRRGAYLATMLFGASGWLLHVARNGDGQALLVIIPLTIMLLTSWVNRTQRHGLALIWTAIIYAAVLFLPGAAWFELASMPIIVRALWRHCRLGAGWQTIIAVVAVFGLAGGLVISLVASPQLLQAWLGLPAHVPDVLTLLRQWGESISFLFVRGPEAPALWLAHTPLLDVFCSAMACIGLYYYACHWRNARTYLLASFLIIGSLLAALNGAAGESYLVAVAYVFVASGLTYALNQWLIVFPRNPVAQAAGFGLLLLAVACSMVYNGLAYFVAWHYSPDTRPAFSRRL